MAESYVTSLLKHPTLWTALVATPVVYILGVFFNRCWTIHQRNQVLLKGFPSAERHWLLGSMGKMKGGGPEFFQTHLERVQKYKYAFITWLGYFMGAVQLVHPEPIKAVLKGSDPKSYIYKQSLIDWLGEGLLIKSGAKWQRNRRLLTPAFHFDILKTYMGIYNDAAEIFMEKLEQMESDRKGFELFNHVSLMTLDVVLRCAFSFETDCQRKRHAYIDAVYELSHLWNAMATNPLYLMFPWTYWWTSKGRRFKVLCDITHREADKVIEQRRKQLEQNDDIIPDNKKYLDFLDILLVAKDPDGNGMSKDDIRAEVDTFLFEGHDTTASGISWALYLLATHPEFQQRAQQEIDTILEGRPSKEILWEDLSKMTYTTMCLKEAMRVYPPVPIFARELSRDVEFRGNVIPRGTYVGIHVWSCHHNPLVWGEDHMEYKPDRFLPENIKTMDSHAFIPFSAGPRNCIGQNFALNEEKTILARLLSRYTFKLAPDCPERMLELRLVLRTRKDFKLLAIPRQ